MMTHLFMALGIVGMAVAIFALGFQSARIWMDWRDDKALRAAEARYERHSHRKVPLARLADPTPFPGEDWRFAGGWDEGPGPVSAEYELLTQTAPDPEPEPDEIGSLAWVTQRLEEVRADERAERLTDTGEMRALSAAWIEKMQGDSNEWIFTHLMRTSE